MIQQLISTSAPKCLNGNAGFGIVAQTHGMAPNVANTVNALSAYAHRFPAGNPQNPVVFLHTLRRTGGMLRHIVSRVADCGNDYTGRTNRLAHHWLVEENDVWTLPCGPAALAAQAIFRTEWNEVSRELPQKDLENVPIVVRKCTKWEQLTGDAGWAGIVAERAEKGDPISIIFKTGMNPVVLLAEVFALLPPEVRWQTSFSTFFIKSQEPAGGSREDKIQIKCFLEGTEEANFARQSPNTLVIDLRQKLPTGQQLFAAGACPAPGKYVETARTGQVQTASPGLAPMPQAREKSPSEYAGHSGKEAAFVMPTPSAQEQEVFDIDNLTLGVPKMSRGLTAADRAKAKRRKQQSPWLTLSACAGVVLVGAGILVWLLVSMRSPTDIAKGRTEPQQTQVTVDTKQGQEPPVSHGTEIVDEPESKPEQTPEPPTNPLPDNADKTETATPPDTPQINPEEEKKKANEKKREEIQTTLNKLPDVWEGLALPKPEFKPLELTEILNIKGVKPEEIKIEYIPFVNFNTIIVNNEFNHKILVDKQLIKWELEEQTDSKKRTPIAEISIKDAEIMLQWISKQSANTQSTTAGRQLFNRILLAKLKIIVASDGVAPLTKEIALWQPVKRSDLKLPAKDKEMFTLWEQKEDTSKRGVASELPQEKPFVVSLSDDHCPLYLVFSNCTVDSKECKRDGIQVFATDNPKGFSPCLAYVDDVGDADKIEIPLQIHVSVDKDNFKFSFVIKPNEDEVQEKLIKPNEEKKEENSKILTKINEREKLQEKKDKTTKEEKDRLAILNTEIGSHKKEDLEKKNKELENKIEQIKNVQKAASQAAYHIGTFSIYLLKSGSTKENALNSENQLLLLEVKEK